jgi:hypothetical protein
MTLRLLTIALLATLVSLFLACDKTPTPEQVADKYIKAVTHMDIETAYTMVSADARAKTPIEKAMEEKGKLMQTGLYVVLDLLGEKTTHKINSATIEGDAATVDYTLSSPDLKPVFKDPEFMDLIRSKGNDPENLRKALATRLSQPDILVQDQAKKLSLVKEEGKWVVKDFRLQ